ncbi:glycoside hydrolase family 78 protein [Pedobacter frigoris]|uniref:glycoside hydrolase family 78 protein n=1 Tax=Pedobacter frigoris TaxID=2571272 RepID=UPI00292FCA0A|nr:glycoside hydrolase family 78 protein [Pedobacter frigoris]
MKFNLPKLFRFSVLMLVAFPLPEKAYSLAGAKPVDLQCEHLSTPIGIDVRQPRLSWKLMDDRQGARQTAYRLIIGTDSATVAKNKGTAWDSGKLLSSNSLVTYNGKPLAPFTKYYWLVEVWDKDGKPALNAEVSSFETGMMEMSNWKGSWISDSQDVNTKPAPYFRKMFSAEKKIKSARAYIACGGLYELYLNGRKVGNHRMDPMYTRFDRRTLYVSYDITGQLQNGKNAIGVLLGNGWYNHQSTAVWDFHKAPWRNRPAFCLDLRITYADGSVETVTSGREWKTALSPIIFNSIYTAEHYDARLEQSGWNAVNFDDTKWRTSVPRSAPSDQIVAQVLHPIRNVETIPAKTVNRINDTAYVFDLGRNISGVSQIKVRGEAGTVIRLKHTERLYPNGRADMSNIDQHYRPIGDQDPFQTDIFILNGTGEESFMPHFNYKGFQYVEVTADKPIKLDQSSITGYFMHSDVPVAGNIKSSNPTLDKIWYAANNSYLSNLFGYPTDCPQREKNGWTGDAHIAVETGLYNFDGITIYEKWLADHRDEQQPNGVLPSIIPTGGWGYEWGNGPDWTSTIAIIPWNIYQYYGDAGILASNYQNIKRYVDHIQDIAPSGLTEWGLGDWVPVSTKPPVEFTSSVYYFVDATILAKIAVVLNKPEDAKKYLALAEKIRGAFNKKYLNAGTGIYGTGLQTELSMPLYWGLVPDALKSKVAANLAKKVADSNHHIDVGLLGTKAILNALSENGYADLAYQVAVQETYPSWGWWIVNGATTLYENWRIDAKSDISLNHIMFGEIGGWFFKGLGGIRVDESQPGFKNVLLQPNFVSGLNHFEASHDGPYGEILSSWKREGNAVIYTVTIPANSTATLMLPLENGKKVYQHGKMISGKMELKAGKYEFEIK